MQNKKYSSIKHLKCINRRSHNRNKIEKEKEGRERYNSSKEMRKQVLGETNCSSQNDECANEITSDVPKTRNVPIKRNRCRAFANAFTKSTRTELS